MFRKIFEQSLEEKTINPDMNRELIYFANSIAKIEKEYYGLNIRSNIERSDLFTDKRYVNSKEYMEKIENSFSDLNLYLKALAAMLKNTNFIDPKFEVKTKTKSLSKR